LTVRASGAVQALHQVAEAGAARGPGAVDGDELGIVDKRLAQGVGVVGVPSRIEAVFELADGVFVGVGHGGCSLVVRRATVCRRSNNSISLRQLSNSHGVSKGVKRCAHVLPIQSPRGLRYAQPTCACCPLCNLR
jgi:hypothetical protein